jgi:hypothetical protein
MLVEAAAALRTPAANPSETTPAGIAPTTIATTPAKWEKQKDRSPIAIE